MNRTASNTGGRIPLSEKNARKHLVSHLPVATWRDIEDARDDSRNGRGQAAEPAEPRVRRTQRGHVRDGSDKGDGEGPEDDDGGRDGVRDELSDRSLVGVHAQVAPDDDLGRNLDVAAVHGVGLVVNETLAGEVGSDLLGEEDEGRVEGRVLLVVARSGTGNVLRELLPLALEVGVVLDNLLLAPVDGVDLLTDERESERHPLGRGQSVRGSVFGRNKSLGKRTLSLGTGWAGGPLLVEGSAILLAGGLLGLESQLVGGLDQRRGGRLELLGGLEPVVVVVGHVLEVSVGGTARSIDKRQFSEVESMTDTAHAPVEPNVLSSSRDVAEQLLELDLIQVYRVANKRARQYSAQERDDCGEDKHVKGKSTHTLLGDTGEEDGPGLGQLGVRVRDEVSLSDREPVFHLNPDVVEDPNCGQERVRTGVSNRTPVWPAIFILLSETGTHR